MKVRTSFDKCIYGNKLTPHRPKQATKQSHNQSYQHDSPEQDARYRKQRAERCERDKVRAEQHHRGICKLEGAPNGRMRHYLGRTYPSTYPQFVKSNAFPNAPSHRYFGSDVCRTCLPKYSEKDKGVITSYCHFVIGRDCFRV